ncbi:unnamed protein product [Prorocentrum cordatum]|uniref:Uncharacterized protein n=1 Tax=Prorocentrum cordatum TaxID=2364126 RepID=A0ABN9QVU5_9DINO|nr:unnamed protein product [Polarella glacialis]
MAARGRLSMRSRLAAAFALRHGGCPAEPGTEPPAEGQPEAQSAAALLDASACAAATPRGADGRPGTRSGADAPAPQRPSGEAKVAHRACLQREIERALAEELDGLRKGLAEAAAGPRERALPPPRPPPPAPRPPRRACAAREAVRPSAECTQGTSAGEKLVWGQRAWSPGPSALEQDLEPHEHGGRSSPSRTLRTAAPELPREERLAWEHAKAGEQDAQRAQRWRAAAVAREEARARHASEQAARDAELEEALLEARARFRPGQEKVLEAASRLRAQRSQRPAAAEPAPAHRRPPAAEEDEELQAAEQRRREELQARISAEEARWEQALERERAQQEEARAAWRRDTEAALAGRADAMSEVERRRRLHAARAREEMERLERLAQERRRDLEDPRTTSPPAVDGAAQALRGRAERGLHRLRPWLPGQHVRGARGCARRPPCPRKGARPFSRSCACSGIRTRTPRTRRWPPRCSNSCRS